MLLPRGFYAAEGRGVLCKNVVLCCQDGLMLLRGGGVMLPGGVLYKQGCVIELPGAWYAAKEGVIVLREGGVMLSRGCHWDAMAVLLCHGGVIMQGSNAAKGILSSYWGGVIMPRGYCATEGSDSIWLRYCQGGVIKLPRGCNLAVSWRLMLQFSVALWCSFVQLMRSRSQQLGAMHLTRVEYGFSAVWSDRIKALWTKWLLLTLRKKQLTCVQYSFVQCAAVSHRSDKKRSGSSDYYLLSVYCSWNERRTVVFTRLQWGVHGELCTAVRSDQNGQLQCLVVKQEVNCCNELQ